MLSFLDFSFCLKFIGQAFSPDSRTAASADESEAVIMVHSFAILMARDLFCHLLGVSGRNLEGEIYRSPLNFVQAAIFVLL